jgi:16S rRNA (guanine966-N2)-methyltransferase
VPARVTRPTSERAREALFNTLRAELDLTGARVLDLYAGSGAVGLEALSRGASAAVFVESDRRAATVLQENITTLQLEGATVHRCTATTFLSAVGAAEPFDLVFIDPPYALASAAVSNLLVTLVKDRWLVPDAVVVVERPWREAQPPWPNEIKAIKQRRYGEGCLWYGRRE